MSEWIDITNKAKKKLPVIDREFLDMYIDEYATRIYIQMMYKRKLNFSKIAPYKEQNIEYILNNTWESILKDQLHKITSHRQCFPGFMGFNRVTDRTHITRWLDDMTHPEEACVHACYVIRKYINGKGAADIIMGNLRKGFQHYGRRKDPNERIWAMIETMFINSIHQYYWTMEKKMHDPL